ncbi:hypothetical protein P8452_70185 [Trifolium repens]|nr:hypothetical protein P8452_70185 [Trifolium repens]
MIGFVLCSRGCLICLCGFKGTILGVTRSYSERYYRICGMDSGFDSVLDGLHETIPSFDLSNFTRKDTVPLKAQHVLARALFGKIVQDMEVKFNMTTREKVVFGCLRAEHAQDFILAIHIDGLGQHMSPIEYRTILKYRLMIPLFPIDEVCPVCRKVCLDNFGEHAVHCRELTGFKYRHNFVRDVIFDVFRCAGISAKKEAHVNFLTDPQEGRSTLRPADVIVYGWVGGRHACVDLTGVSPLVDLRAGTFTVGQAALKAASSKVARHEKACFDNQHAFIPFAFDTFGFLAPEAASLLQRVQKVMNSNVVSPRAKMLFLRELILLFKKG